LLASASKPNRVTMRESNSQLEEVVVTGYGTKKRKEIAGSASTIPETVPEGGWPSLIDYLKKKINTGKENNTGSVLHGSVTVELTLKNGKVRKVVIKQSFNDSLNPTLIHAIKNGPNWSSSIVPGKKEKRTVNFAL
jgi:hypothetical protein